MKMGRHTPQKITICIERMNHEKSATKALISARFSLMPFEKKYFARPFFGHRIVDEIADALLQDLLGRWGRTIEIFPSVARNGPSRDMRHIVRCDTGGITRQRGTCRFSVCDHPRTASWKASLRLSALSNTRAGSSLRLSTTFSSGRAM